MHCSVHFGDLDVHCALWRDGCVLWRVLDVHCALFSAVCTVERFVLWRVLDVHCGES